MFLWVDCSSCCHNSGGCNFWTRGYNTRVRRCHKCTKPSNRMLIWYIVWRYLHRAIDSGNSGYPRLNILHLGQCLGGSHHPWISFQPFKCQDCGTSSSRVQVQRVLPAKERSLHLHKLPTSDRQVPGHLQERLQLSQDPCRHVRPLPAGDRRPVLS